MYETGSGLKPFLSKGETPYPEEGIPTLQPFPPHVSKTRSQLSFAISFPVPFFHPFPPLPLFVHPFLGSGDVIRNMSYISSRQLPKTIIPHSFVVHWCRLVVRSCALETMLLFWSFLKLCTVFNVDEALKLPYKYCVFVMHDNFTHTVLSPVFGLSLIP